MPSLVEGGFLMSRLVSYAGVLLVAGLSSSCFAVTDLDRFKTQEQSAGNFSDLRLTVRGMTSHTKELFEYRVVDNANVIQSRGFVQPLGGVEATLFVRGAVPKQNGPFHLDFYADHDDSLGYDQRQGQGDHSWRLPLDDKVQNDQGTFVVLFDHNTSFSYLNDPSPPREIGKSCVVRLKNMQAFQGKRVEARVADASSKRVVALFRVPVADKPDFDLTIPGMVEPGVTYAVEIYTDDGKASPGTVKAFRFDAESAETGLDATFNAGGPVTQVDDAVSP